jgi:hypothetical protein
MFNSPAMGHCRLFTMALLMRQVAAMSIDTSRAVAPQPFGCASRSQLFSRARLMRLAIGEVPQGFLGEDQLGDWVTLKKSTALGASATRTIPAAALELLTTVQTSPQSIEFDAVIEMIDTNFDINPTGFTVGDVKSEAGENMGSSKLLGLGKLVGLSEQETLCLFGKYYKSVCANPDGTDHPNIRAFMKGGWGVVDFPWGLSISIPVDGKSFDTSAESVASALAASAQISGDDEWDPDSEIWIP